MIGLLFFLSTYTTPLMNVALWICQGLLALIFLYSGVTKGFKPVPELVKMGQTGLEGLSDRFVHTIGIAELFGVVGIILPWALQVAPILTPITAVCFALVMVFSTVIHYRHRNYTQVASHLLILAVALFVAFNRFAQLR